MNWKFYSLKLVQSLTWLQRPLPFPYQRWIINLIVNYADIRPINNQFRHSVHLQPSPHFWPAARHSQYFFEHFDLIQLQVISVFFPLCFFWKLLLSTFRQLSHLQSSVQARPFLKQKQYSFRHWDFAQWQGKWASFFYGFFSASSLCFSFLTG